MSDNTEKTSVSNSDWKKRELGALWRREGRNQNFLSGTLKLGEFGVEKEFKIVVFTNKGKEKNERAPDFIVYEDRPREDEFAMSSAGGSKQAEGQSGEAQKETQKETQPNSLAEADEDIPAVLQ